VTMLWFYVSSVAVLIGAEVNAVIEKERQERPVTDESAPLRRPPARPRRSNTPATDHVRS
jgi:uncharacterized BrkB/YihY/UPF0761 family membrane protein